MKRIALGATTLLPIALSVPAAIVSAPAYAAPQDAVCMAGTASGTAQGKTFTIIVPQSHVSELEGRGFVVEPCQGKNNSVPQYRTEICNLAGTAPQGVKDSLADTYGIGPDELCNLVKEL